MHIQASYAFDAPPQDVWNLLMDTALIASCIPGCDRLEPLGDERYRARLNVSLAAITGAFDGTVAMLDQQPPSSYRLLIEGQGRSGFVKGESRVALAGLDGATTVTVDADVQVGGAIARVGQRMLSSVAKMMMDRFFGCLHGKLRP
jgi:carbon monoxide dehydrogenase subunit G